MEAQVEGNGDLDIRRRVNDGYEKIVTAIFASLTHLAKMDKGEGQAAEDKGQLNYHVIMIGTLLLTVFWCGALIKRRKHVPLCRGSATDRRPSFGSLPGTSKGAV